MLHCSWARGGELQEAYAITHGQCVGFFCLIVLCYQRRFHLLGVGGSGGKWQWFFKIKYHLEEKRKPRITSIPHWGIAGRPTEGAQMDIDLLTWCMERRGIVGCLHAICNRTLETHTSTYVTLRHQLPTHLYSRLLGLEPCCQVFPFFYARIGVLFKTADKNMKLFFRKYRAFPSWGRSLF